MFKRSQIIPILPEISPVSHSRDPLSNNVLSGTQNFEFFFFFSFFYIALIHGPTRLGSTMNLKLLQTPRLNTSF